MWVVADIVAQFGGVATKAQLLSHGLERDLIEHAADRRIVLRARRGYYVSNNLPRDVIAAVRVGGRLGCVSALRHHGEPVEDDGRLHVAVPRSRSGLRIPPDRDVVVHWMRRPSRGGPLAVSIDEARAQATRCRALSRAG